MNEICFNLADVNSAVLELTKNLKCSFIFEGDKGSASPSEDELDDALRRVLTNIVAQVKAYATKGFAPETLYSVEKCGNNVLFINYFPITQTLRFFKIEGKLSIFESQAKFNMFESADLSNEVVLAK